MVFGRRVGNRVLTFGVSGMLRQNNLIMWDWETDSWWQQGTGQAIVGELAGTQLEMFAAPHLSWRDFKEAYPRGRVLSRQSIPFYNALGMYGTTPYRGYDSEAGAFGIGVDPRLDPMERVVGIRGRERQVAYPYSVLARLRVVYDRLEGQEHVILFRPDTRSPLDADRIAEGRLVGSAGVYRPLAQGLRLTLEPLPNGLFRDRETGSEWNVFGVAVKGKLKGQRMAPVFHDSPFWFYWSTLYPQTEVLQP